MNNYLTLAIDLIFTEMSATSMPPDTPVGFLAHPFQENGRCLLKEQKSTYLIAQV